MPWQTCVSFLLLTLYTVTQENSGLGMRGNTCTLWWMCPDKTELKRGRSFGILSHSFSWALPVLSSTPALPSSKRLRASCLLRCALLHSAHPSLELTVNSGPVPRPWVLCKSPGMFVYNAFSHRPAYTVVHTVVKGQGLACCTIQKKPTFGQVFFKTMALFPSLSAFLKRKTRNKALKHSNFYC